MENVEFTMLNVEGSKTGHRISNDRERKLHAINRFCPILSRRLHALHRGTGKEQKSESVASSTFTSHSVAHGILAGLPTCIPAYLPTSFYLATYTYLPTYIFYLSIFNYVPTYTYTYLFTNISTRYLSIPT